MENTTTKDVLEALDGLKNSIHRLPEKHTFHPGSKKSQSWFRKLATIEADIRAEDMRESIMSTIHKRAKE